MSIETTIHNMIIERLTPVIEQMQAIETKASQPVVSKELIEAMIEELIPTSASITVTCLSWSEVEASSEGCHPAVPTLLAKLQHENIHDRNLYIYGPAGTGKTTAAIKLAELLSLALHMQGTAMSKYDLFGFRLPSGDVVRTAFMDAWQHGGVIILDDCDRSDPKAMSALNAATANGTCDFSHCGLGLIPRHPDCVIIATGNTAMNGQDAKYSAASKQDGAFRDRFTFHFLDLDEAFELTVTSNKKWTKRVQSIRAACKKLGGNVDQLVMASMRASIQGASLLAAGLSYAEVEEAVIFKGAGVDVTTLVYSSVGEPEAA